MTSLEHEERALGSVQSSHTKNIVVTCLLDTVWLRKLAKTLTDLRSQAVTPVKPLDVLGRSQRVCKRRESRSSGTCATTRVYTSSIMIHDS